MTGSRNIDYYLATGLVRTREDKLVTSEALERMISADSAKSAYSILTEFDYADELLVVDQPEMYESVITHDLLQVRDFLTEMTDDPVIHGILFSDFDFHNIKLFIKEALFDVDLSEHVSTAGFYNPSVLKDDLTGELDMSRYERELGRLLVEIRAELLEGGDVTSEFVDSFVDSKMFSYRLHLAKKTGVSFLIDLSQRYVDLANMRLVIRARSLGRDISFVEKRFVEGGTMNYSWFKDHFDMSEEDVVSVELAVQNIDEMFVEPYMANSLADFEKNIERYEARLSRNALKSALGPEVIYGYVKLKMARQRDIRRVMSGKLNNVDSEMVYSKLTSLA